MEKLRTMLLAVAVLCAGCAGTAGHAADRGLIGDLLANRKLAKVEADDLPPPGDDAPLETIARYWGDGGRFGGRHVPSEAVRKRFVEAARGYPECLVGLLVYLPTDEATQDVVFELYSRMAVSDLSDKWEKSVVASWLMQAGKYLREDLVAAARAENEIPDVQGLSYGGSVAAALPLAKLDWAEAKPWLERLVSGGRKPESAKAVEVLMEHAEKVSDEAGVRGYLEQLKQLAAVAGVQSQACDEAVRRLMVMEFEGKREFFRQLFGDARFEQTESVSGIAWVNRGNCLAAWVDRNSETELAWVVEQLHNADPVVRKNAVGALLLLNRSDALKPLLPALRDPDGWPEGTAEKVARCLEEVKVAGAAGPLREYYRKLKPADRVWAVFALARQDVEGVGDDIEAILPETENGARRLAMATLCCPAVSNEQLMRILRKAAVIESVDRQYGPSGEMNYGRDVPPMREVVLPRILEMAREWSIGGMARQSDYLLALLSAWNAPAIDGYLAARLATEKPTLTRYKVLMLRGERLRAHAGRELAQVARGGKGAGAGMAAAFSGDKRLRALILENGDDAARMTLLACAANWGLKLPVGLVSRFLDGRSGDVAECARMYLVTENSADAESVLRAHLRGKYTLIGGGKMMPSVEEPAPEGDAALSFDSWDACMWRMAREMQGPDRPDEIFALFTGAAFSDEGNVFVYVRDGKGTLRWQKRFGVYLQRELPAEVLAALRQWLKEHPVEYLPDLGNSGVLDGDGYTFAHFTPAGGRRVSIDNPEVGGSAGGIYDLLARQMRALVGHGEYEYHSAFEELYPGTRVMIHESERRVRMLVKDGEMLKAHVLGDATDEWWVVREGRLAEQADVPRALIDETYAISEKGNWTRAIRSGDGKWSLLEEMGLRIERAGDPPRPPKLPLRYVNVPSGEIRDVPLPAGFDELSGGGYIASRGAFFVYARGVRGALSGWLFDPSVGSLEPCSGQLKPLTQWSGLALQAAGEHSAWLAFYDEQNRMSRIGRYDFDKFAFEAVLTLPDNDVGDTEFWVDEKSGWVLVLAHGDLLRILLPGYPRK